MIKKFPLLAPAADDSERLFRSLIVEQSYRELLENYKKLERFHTELSLVHNECQTLNKLLQSAGESLPETVCETARGRLASVFAEKRAELTACSEEIDKISKEIAAGTTYQRSVAMRANATLTPSTRTETISTEIPDVLF